MEWPSICIKVVDWRVGRRVVTATLCTRQSPTVGDTVVTVTIQLTLRLALEVSTDISLVEAECGATVRELTTSDELTITGL
jgi:hypothetical protein